MTSSEAKELGSRWEFVASDGRRVPMQVVGISRHNGETAYGSVPMRPNAGGGGLIHEAKSAEIGDRWAAIAKEAMKRVTAARASAGASRKVSGSTGRSNDGPLGVGQQHQLQLVSLGR